MSEGVRTQPHQVRIDAREFVHHHANPLRALRDFHAQQLFYRQAVGEVVGHGAEIIDAVGERNHLLVELGLRGLLDTGVQIADVGHHADDGFAVDLDQQVAARRASTGAVVPCSGSSCDRPLGP